MREDAQLEQFAEDGRRLQTIALEFDDDNVAHVAIDACGNIVEPQMGIDGKALCLAYIDERDAIETVLNLLSHRLWGVAQVLAKEIVVSYELLVLTLKTDGMIRVKGIEAFHRHALLLGAPMIVLGLHLEEIEPCIDVRADTQLLAHQMACLVAIIHGAIGRIEVECIIRRDAQTTRLLHEIVVACNLEQLLKHRHRRHKLGVDAVHQPDVFHFFQRDGFIVFENLLQRHSQV